LWNIIRQLSLLIESKNCFLQCSSISNHSSLKSNYPIPLSFLWWLIFSFNLWFLILSLSRKKCKLMNKVLIIVFDKTIWIPIIIFFHSCSNSDRWNISYDFQKTHFLLEFHISHKCFLFQAVHDLYEQNSLLWYSICTLIKIINPTCAWSRVPEIGSLKKNYIYKKRIIAGEK